MIVISNKSTINTVYFPKNIYNENRESNTEYDYKLILINRGTNKEYEFNVNDEKIANYGFYTFKLNLSNLPDCEYEYKINSENETLANGIIRINSLVDKQENINLEYNDNRTYVAYDKQ